MNITLALRHIASRHQEDSILYLAALSWETVAYL